MCARCVWISHPRLTHVYFSHKCITGYIYMCWLSVGRTPVKVTYSKLSCLHEWINQQSMRCCGLVCPAQRQNGPSAEKCEKDEVAANCVFWQCVELFLIQKKQITKSIYKYTTLYHKKYSPIRSGLWLQDISIVVFRPFLYSCALMLRLIVLLEIKSSRKWQVSCRLHQVFSRISLYLIRFILLYTLTSLPGPAAA